ncbi:MAG: alpha/beta hydrolase [Gaiellales bacterium]
MSFQPSSAGTPDPLTYLVRPAAGEPAGALVLIHGRGANEGDLAPLAAELDPERRLVALCPRGPLSLPPGGAHWYRLGGLGTPDPDTFMPTFGRLVAWLDAALAEHGIGLERTVIGGFSQGAVMSWALGLGQGRPTPAGILALSGFMPTVERCPLDLDRPGLRTAIGHGTHDPIIGVEWGRQARDRLRAAGHEPVYRESPMGHSIDPGFLDELRDWVAGSVSAHQTGR